MDSFIPLCKADELPIGEMKAFTVGNRRILLANVSGTYYAMDGECTHECGYLDEGDLEEDTVVCPIHFARFSIITGKVLEGPAEEDAVCYKVEVRNGTVFVSFK
ncbi:Rieske (2Fe-2S) protein [Ferviditalea candida]|uniref:Non-heme iron oxygenase ferredoxin subunit n=1 Tax=Ferviditalea candida TaxID=3108399 RepID=A0ABU5ZME4_9BACL|nr:non-heme iron oxygenase ferredoxin subunit [Paenibacillaceae bacterium T2]